MSQPNQIQAVPVRFNPQLIVDAIGNQQPTGQIITMQSTSNQSSSGGTVTVVPTVSTVTAHNLTNAAAHHQTHMLIPVPAKVSASSNSSPRPSILRKRDIEG